MIVLMDTISSDADTPEGVSDVLALSMIRFQRYHRNSMSYLPILQRETAAPIAAIYYYVKFCV